MQKASRWPIVLVVALVALVLISNFITKRALTSRIQDIAKQNTALQEKVELLRNTPVQINNITEDVAKQTFADGAVFGYLVSKVAVTNQLTPEQVVVAAANLKVLAAQQQKEMQSKSAAPNVEKPTEFKAAPAPEAKPEAKKSKKFLGLW